jgi:glucose-6-phosphate 1-dehydrogenase
VPRAAATATHQQLSATTHAHDTLERPPPHATPHPPRRERCADAQEKFLQRCFYQAGPYDGPEGFAALSQRLSELEAHKPRANRMFFLSIPPNVFLPATGNATEQARSK